MVCIASYDDNLQLIIGFREFPYALLYTRAREGRVFLFLKATFNHTTPRSRATEASRLNQRSLQLVTTIYSTCHDDLPNLSRRFHQFVTTISSICHDDLEAPSGRRRGKYWKTATYWQLQTLFYCGFRSLLSIPIFCSRRVGFSVWNIKYPCIKKVLISTYKKSESSSRRLTFLHRRLYMITI